MTDEVPIEFPFESQTIMDTVAAAELGLTMATPLVKAVSSNVSVVVVAVELENGTTAS